MDRIQSRARYTRGGTGVSAAEARTPDEIARNRTLQRKLFDAGGWAGISYPEAYGGRGGLSEAHERVFTEESSNYVTPDFGAVGLVTFGPIGRSMLAHATPAFLERHIPKMLAGDALWCQFYSEPEAGGSDLAGIRTRATRDGENWVIRGSKIWTTGGAQNADYAMCLARTDWHVSKHRGLTWFAVPTSAKGVAIRPIVLVDGNAGFCEETLDDVVVSDADIIGQINDGWSVAQTMLVYERRAGEGFMVSEPRELAPDLVALARKANRLGGSDREAGHSARTYQRLRTTPSRKALVRRPTGLGDTESGGRRIHQTGRRRPRTATGSAGYGNRRHQRRRLGR